MVPQGEAVIRAQQIIWGMRNLNSLRAVKFIDPSECHVKTFFSLKKLILFQ